jgi:type III restriction enzyme
MKLKEFQRRTVERVADYFQSLRTSRENAAAIEEQFPGTGVDWVAKAWEQSVGSQYIPRKDGIGRPLPTACLKIPTGGGKTLLATHVIDLFNRHYRMQQTGLVLWVVPSTQIYRQTLQALKDRSHPYRQTLDVTSGNRTEIFEKTNGFSPAQIKENLCILLLMLPAANRETKEQLRMFRDSGGFDRFFPEESDVEAQKQLVADIPNLDTFSQDGFWGPQIKTSLGNTLRQLNPLIILDEGHKAYSEGAKKTLEGFNPSMIVELSATPPKESNVLIEISGRELNDEEMIKLDLHVQNRTDSSWKDTLLAGIEHRARLEEVADEYKSETNLYIRPIQLIQVERTGKEQRDGKHIHADDVKEYLLRHPTITPDQIAIKTSQKDELKEVDEIGGLLSPDCTIRYIITKQALQEGWDCPFAYVLTVLTNPSSKTALTQLVGRILRQPYAQKTGVQALDESYVFCFRRNAGDLLADIRKGFGLEGLGDMQGHIVSGEEGNTGSETLGEVETHQPRERFRNAVKQTVLPAFMIKEGGKKKTWRLVHYETDILSRVPWGDVEVGPVYDLNLLEPTGQNVELTARLPEEDHPFDEMRWQHAMPLPTDSAGIDLSFAAAHLLDVMPNPWRGYKIAKEVFAKFEKKYGKPKTEGNFLLILEELRRVLERERDRMAKAVFLDLLQEGTMRFMIVTEDLGFNRLPKSKEIRKGTRRANRQDGSQLLMSLFESVPEEEMGDWENKIASFLDEQERLFFWYRNLDRKDYYVQGWKRGKIFADFIFTLTEDQGKEDYHRAFVLETKGQHLKGNVDTEYKRSVFDICNQNAKKADWNSLVPAMKNKVLRYEIVDEDEWEKRLSSLIG